MKIEYNSNLYLIKKHSLDKETWTEVYILWVVRWEMKIDGFLSLFWKRNWSHQSGLDFLYNLVMKERDSNLLIYHLNQDNIPTRLT